MLALVTGPSGFVGRHLLDHLIACGDAVICSEAEITDADALADDFSPHRPDAVFHLAAQAHVQASFDDPAATVRVNVEGTLNVLEASRRVGARRVVMISSADVYGRVDATELPVTEHTPMRPVTPYGASKAAAEMLCLQANLGHGTEVIRARAFNHCGPGQADRFVASALASRIAANERSGSDEVPVGNLLARRDFTDVRDVVRAYRLLATDGTAGEVYNVCSGVSRPVSEIAEALISRARHPMHLHCDQQLTRPVDIAEVRGDPTKLHSATGWRPEIGFDHTIDDLLDYWRGRVALAEGAQSQPGESGDNQ